MEPDEFPSPFSNIFADLLAEGRLLHESLRSQMPTPWRERSLTIEILDDIQLNALTASRQDGYVIRVNRGVLQHVFGTTLGLCCCTDFLPNVGNAAGEMEPTLTAGRFPPIPLLEEDDDTNILVPRDQTRGTIAHMLAEIAIHFLLYHEIGHVVGGHIELLRSTPGTTWSLPEYTSTGSEERSTSLRHALECDADAFACHVSSNALTAKVMADEVSNLMQTDLWPPEDCAYITILTAVSVLFRMLYPTAPTTIGAAQGTHPHPAVRDFVVGSCALARGMAREQLTVVKLNGLLRDSVRNVEEVWAGHCLRGQTLAPPASWAADVRRGAHELFDAHAKHEGLLERHAHLPRRWHDWKWSSCES